MTTLGHTILIVDDELSNRKLLEALLHPEGYVTLTASTGQEALDLVERQPPDLILLDVMMPDMTGYEVATRLKGQVATSSIPIVMVTAQTDHSALLKGLEAGAEEFLSKPINRPELWLRVRNLMRLKEMRDLIEHQNEILEQEGTAKLQRFRTAMDATGDAIFLVDAATERFVEVNATASRMFGYSRDEFLGLGSISLGATTQIELERLRDAIIGSPTSESLTEERIRRKDGWHLPVEVHRQAQLTGGEPITVGVVRDITEREEAQLHLYRLAHHDALTGLPNRTSFYEMLTKMLIQARHSNWGIALLYIDLDRFKKINDAHGHAAGDVLLGEVGERLRRCVRLRDTVGRLGGDEFAIIMILENRRAGVTAIAEKIRSALTAPFTLGDYEVSVAASIGIASFPEDSADPDLLMKYADTAMYEAKRQGRDNYCIFTPQMNADLLDQLSLEAALHKAIDYHEFLIHYQPKFASMTGDLTGFEALLRWQRPGYGLVSPNHFIPALEETGLIVPVGKWVINSVCEQIREWTLSPIGPRQVAVNVSGRQFVEHDLPGDVARALQKSGIDAGLLELELTESSLMQNTEATISALLALKKQGVVLSIDDFGTGYSSLAYLQRFPIDKVKIDISFVRNITEGLDDPTIAQTIIQVAHSLRMKAIAEGVESAAQAAYLRHHGCDEMQGYYFSRPLPLEGIETLVRQKALPVGSEATAPTVLMQSLTEELTGGEPASTIAPVRVA